MRRWIALLGVFYLIGCSSFAYRPTEYDMRKQRPELQKHYPASVLRIYSASKVALRDLGWQIVADRFLGSEARIEAHKGGGKMTVFIEQISPIRTRVVSTSSSVHQRIAGILHIEPVD